MSVAERSTLVAFAVTVTLWILPGIVALIAGTESSAYTTVSDRLDEGVVAILGASLLFLLPTKWEDREFTLRWSDAAKIDWGTVVLFGTGIIFGSLLESCRAGRDDRQRRLGRPRPHQRLLDHGLRRGPGHPGLGDDKQHAASAAVVVPIVIPIAVAAGVDPFVPALAATFAASFGFMLPVSTPQNAVVYGSGTVPMRR